MLVALATRAGASGSGRALDTVRRSLIGGLVLVIGALAPVPAGGTPLCETVGTTSAEPCELWTARYNNATPSPFDVEADFANAVAVSSDSSKVFVTGRSWGGGDKDYDLFTSSYDAASGTELWTFRYDGATHSYDYGTALATAPDGSAVYTAGPIAETVGGLTSWIALVAALDPVTGDVLWLTPDDGLEIFGGNPTDLEVSPDGDRLFVTGYGEGPERSVANLGIVAFDTTTGEALWALEDAGGALAVDPDGGTLYAAGGAATEETGLDATIVAYDVDTGQERWSGRSGAPGDDVSGEVAVAGDRLVVTGSGPGDGPNASDSDYITTAFSKATGEPLWTKRFDGPTRFYDAPTGIGAAPDGSTVYVTGITWYLSNTPPPYLFDSDYHTIAYDVATGAERWSATYDGSDGEDDVAADLVVRPDGSRIYVLGHSRIPGVWRYATVAYDAVTGAEVWESRHGGAAGLWGEAAALAVAPDGGRVFATGAGMGADWFDAYTVAYQG